MASSVSRRTVPAGTAAAIAVGAAVTTAGSPAAAHGKGPKPPAPAASR